MLLEVSLSYTQISCALDEILTGDLISTQKIGLSLLTSLDPVMRNITRRSGVYLLYYKGEIFYIGKSSRTVITRLRKHKKSLKDSLPYIECQVVNIADRNIILAAEDKLICHYSPVLNGTNFGNNGDKVREASSRPKQKDWQPVFEEFVRKVDGV